MGERPTEQESGANRRKGRVVGLSLPGFMGRQDSTEQSNGEITGRHCAPEPQARHVVTC